MQGQRLPDWATGTIPSTTSFSPTGAPAAKRRSKHIDEAKVEKAEYDSKGKGPKIPGHERASQLRAKLQRRHPIGFTDA